MRDIIGQTGIAEVMLLFVLLFVLPGMTFLLMKLRKYEELHGPLPTEKKGKKKKKKKGEDQPAEPAAPVAAAPAATTAAQTVPADVYPYKPKPFMTPPERSCLAALREALGAEVEVYPKVALWETVDPSEPNPGYAVRLHGRNLDFLVCDKRTGAVLSGVMFNPAKGKPSGPGDEVKKICDAAALGVVFIDMAEKYDAKKLKDALGIPDLDM